jgi:tRNA-2-methylthio-N6-dimethylallyladenosine synthase
MPDDVSEGDKTRRIVELQALQREIQRDLNQAAVGRYVEVLVDGRSRRGDELSGRSSGNTVVNFPGPDQWQGRLVDVLIQRAGPNSLQGTPKASLDTRGAHAYGGTGTPGA